MAESSEYQQKKAAEQLSNYVLSRMKQGKDKKAIAAELKADGAQHEQVDRVVGEMYDAIMKAARHQQFTSASWQPAIVGGLGAAIIGGIIWSLIMIYTGYEAGLVAWGLGWFTGWAVVKLTGGKKGIQAQAVAVICSLIGIFLGKYISFYHFLSTQQGETSGAEISFFSMALLQQFFEHIKGLVQPLDLLFFGAAVYTAWTLTRGLGLKVPETGVPPELMR